MRNVLLALLVLMLGAGVGYFFFRTSKTMVPEEVLNALREGTHADRQVRIKWLAQRYANDKDFWLRMINHEDQRVRHGIYEAVARFRKNIPEFFYTVYDNGDKADKLAIYSALPYILPYCDLGFTERLLTDCAGDDDELRKSAYGLMALVSTEDWTPNEIKSSLESSPISLRWVSWWETNRNRNRKDLIESFSLKLLDRYCAPELPVRQRAFETLRLIYGEEPFGLPSNANQPEWAPVLNWWENTKGYTLPRLMNSIEWDLYNYKGL